MNMHELAAYSGLPLQTVWNLYSSGRLWSSNSRTPTFTRQTGDWLRKHYTPTPHMPLWLDFYVTELVEDGEHNGHRGRKTTN